MLRLTPKQRIREAAHGTDRIHRARQHGPADGAEPDQGRAPGRGRRCQRGGDRQAAKPAGGAVAETAKIAAARADVVITMLPAGQHVREVYLGAGGIIENANAGTLLIDCSTIDVETARAVAAAAEAKGLLMLDAPVSGGVGGAQRRHAHLHGRRQRARLRARASRSCRQMGKTIVHAGGAGQRAGGEDLQQHDPRRVDDRGVGGLRARREARARRAEAVRHLLEVVRASAGR